jgi:hypothetical protein
MRHTRARPHTHTHIYMILANNVSLNCVATHVEGILREEDPRAKHLACFPNEEELFVNLETMINDRLQEHDSGTEFGNEASNISGETFFEINQSIVVVGLSRSHYRIFMQLRAICVRVIYLYSMI